jgi:lactate dehydrogenase-like 2-hydroxyacid dehydrogenase
MIGIDESKLDPDYWKKIDSLAEKIIKLPKDSPEIMKQLADVDCLLVNFGVDVRRDHIDAAPNLKYIGTLSIAFNRVDIGYAKTKGISVCNLAGYCTEAVAEFVFAAILEQMRELERGKQVAREADYSGSGFSAIEIKDKIFGVLGLGRIGTRVAEIALGFGAKVCYWSRNRKTNIEKKGIKFEDADRLVSEGDFISLNFALTNDTKNFLNEERMENIKSGAIIINTCPMELVDLDALEKRLAKGDITFILDHSDEMSAEELTKISKYKNCIIYPPIAYASKEARIEKQRLFVGNMENFLRGSPTNKVN